MPYPIDLESHLLSGEVRDGRKREGYDDFFASLKKLMPSDVQDFDFLTFVMTAEGLWRC